MIKDICCNILFVNEDNNTINLFKEYLKDIDCNIIGAKTNDEIFKMLSMHSFVLIMLPVKTKNIYGFKIFKKIKTSKDIPYIPVMFLTTADKAKTYYYKSYKLGAVDYLIAPVAKEVLQPKIKVFMELGKQKSLLQQQSFLLEKQIEEMITLKNKNDKLESLSFSDGLTGIANRRHFESYSARCWRDAINNKQPLSFILCDIDYFKEYNDTFGHLKGDQVLIKVAKCIFDTLTRPVDFMARFGGEEFIIVLPNSNEKRAYQIVNKIKHNIAKLKIEHRNSPISKYLTLSYGITTQTPDSQRPLNVLINEADMAMYQAKEHGKDNVYLYNLNKH